MSAKANAYDNAWTESFFRKTLIEILQSEGFIDAKDAQTLRRHGGAQTSAEDKLIETLKIAEFVYFRDGVSAQTAKVILDIPKPPALGWGPDTAFGIVKLRDEEARYRPRRMAFHDERRGAHR